MIDRRRVAAVIRKDWLEIARNKQAVAPLIIVPMLFVVAIPTLVIVLGDQPDLAGSTNGVEQFLDQLPDGVVPVGLSAGQAFVFAFLVFFMAPFFLLIPVLIASITASSSFVGEKERRTIEGLLYTPISDRELVLAKVLASVIPSVVLTWLAFAIYTVLVHVLGRTLFSMAGFPNGTWLILIVVLVPLVGFLATSLIVAVSGRSTSMQGAQAASVLLILPVVALVVGQASGVLLFDMPVALELAAILAAVDMGTFALVAGRFSRERIVTRM